MTKRESSLDAVSVSTPIEQGQLRYKCKECGQTFTQTKGTPFYRLRHEQELVGRIVTLLAHGCPPQAIVAAFGLDERTVMDWQQRAATQCRQVHQHLIAQPRELGEVQTDELRVRRQDAIVWFALAIQTATRLWLGGSVSEHRDRWLITRLIHRVRQCALCLPLLLVTDGLAAYGTAWSRVFRDPVARLGRGQRRLQTWVGLCHAQVVKRYRDGESWRLNIASRMAWRSKWKACDIKPTKAGCSARPSSNSSTRRSANGLSSWCAAPAR